MNTENIEDIYPLSPTQHGMLFHSLYGAGTGVYFTQFCCEINDDLDVPALRRAWGHVMRRHPVLRTAFVWEGLDEPLQVVMRELPLPWEELDWRGADPADCPRLLDEFLTSERRQRSDPSRAPLMRLTLVRRPHPQPDLFVWSCHHLLVDGWSMPLLVREVFAAYEAYRKGGEPEGERVRPFRDYIGWLGRQDARAAEGYWRDRLKGFTRPISFCERAEQSGGFDDAYEDLKLSLPAEVSSALGALARREQLTMNTLVQGAWGLVLSRASGERDIVYGVTVSGRPADLEGVEQIMGLFINTLPVRVRVEEGERLLPWLRRLQAEQAEMRQFEHSALVQVQGWTEVPRALPLFESIFVFENYPIEKSLQGQSAGPAIGRVQAVRKPHYPFTFTVWPAEELLLRATYDRARFDDTAVRRLLKNTAALLESFAARSDMSLAEACAMLDDWERQQLRAEGAALTLVSEEERQLLLHDFNDTSAPFPDDRCAHELFEEQAAQRPDALAVVFEDVRLTYRELNERANRLAHYLRGLGVGPEVPVGVCVERSAEMVVSVLAVLKAGGCYLPLDPAYPADRLAFMAEDSKLRVLVTTLAPGDLPPVEGRVVSLEADRELIGRESVENPRPGLTADNLAYVIYTSGSTGRPKGVMLQHRGLCNLAAAQARAFGIGPDSCVLQFASLSFDASVSEVFTALVTGARLLLARRESLMPGPGLASLVAGGGVTTVTMPPAALSALDPRDFGGLRTVVTAGEACPPAVARRWGSEGERRLINAYGPTETTVCATMREVRADDEGAPPIGRLMENVRAYVLDSRGRLVPVGVDGELHVGGVGLARGYLGRPALTAERFVPDPFSDEPGARLYRTGDLARWTTAGELVFIGRADSQVKVRGYRIELGEVEAALGRHEGVREAVVVVRDDEPGGGKRLVAYAVALPGSGLTAQSLREYARGLLPEYMAPSAYVLLEELPLSPNGKVDKKALPAPESAVAAGERVAPRTEAERAVSVVWEEVLGSDSFGVHDNFFDLGGHSLLLVRVASRLSEAFQVSLDLADLFDAPTIAAQAVRAEQARRESKGLNAPPLRPVPRASDMPLSFTQERMWFLDQLNPGSTVYNLHRSIRLKGRLDVSVLEATLNEILRRHEVLRTSFVTMGGRPRPVVEREAKLKVEVVSLEALPAPQREREARKLAAEEARRPFDLSRGPLLRARLLRLGPDEHVALFTTHHIASDGWSMGVLVREVTALYAALLDGRGSPLEELPVQYADFAHWQRTWLAGETLDRHLRYWSKKLEGMPAVLPVRTDRERTGAQSYRGGRLLLNLSKETSDRLRALGRRQDVTLFMTLLAVFDVLLQHHSDTDDIVVGTDVANRDRAETEGVIGFFINQLVLRTDLSGDPTFTELLKRVRETALDAYAHQDLPFDRLVEALNPERNLGHNPLFQVMFGFQTAPTQALKLPGLELSGVGVENDNTVFDLALYMTDAPEGLVGSWTYHLDLFEPSTVARMSEHFELLLSLVIEQPDVRLSRLRAALAEHERRRQAATQHEFLESRRKKLQDLKRRLA